MTQSTGKSCDKSQHSKELVAQLVTPVVLTCNEELNIQRTLESLTWAKRVVVLDSGSNDSTEQICRKYENLSWHVRPFDSFKGQWEFAIRNLVSTDFTLALDADMQVTPEFLNELTEKFFPERAAAGLVPFRYCYHGRQLRGSLCAPQLRVFNRDGIKVEQPAHGHRFETSGSIYAFRNPLIHDDRKPLERWVDAQVSYVKLNAGALQNGGAHRLKDRLRRLGLMPPLMGALAYLRAGGPLSGAAAARYAYERMTAESLLAIRLMDDRIKENN